MVKLSPANPGHLFQIQIMRRQIFGAGPECQWTVERPYLGGIGASKLGLTMVYHIFAMAKIGKVKREFQRQASDIFVQVVLWRERSFSGLPVVRAVLSQPHHRRLSAIQC